MQVDLLSPWWIRDVEIPTRLVLAPMAGVSVQAFRRQGRRFGAGPVCSGKVSRAGIEPPHERAAGHLRGRGARDPLRSPDLRSDPGGAAAGPRRGGAPARG